jgi:tungstate transport system substrate-binding protein
MLNRRSLAYAISAFALFVLAGGTGLAATERFITVVSTTSTENSGLFARILPIFTARTGIEVRVVAVGTGQAIRMARNGDADVLLVHHKPSEQAFVAEGFGVERFDVMYNDFIVVGPRSDPAGVRNAPQVTDALKQIVAYRAIFISRGDDSGTHKRELALWRGADIDPVRHSGSWYQEVGAGMGATLNMAAAKRAYTLSDRGTWLSFEGKGELAILNEGDARLLNPYGAILVNPDRFAHVKAREGQIFIDWLLSDEGQQAIGEYQIDGEQLFFPNAAS